MALNIPQYQPSGDMLSTINDYWSGRPEGSDHNSEWAGANPAEYWTRKYGEALNWKRGQAELEARKQAELLRQQMEQKKQAYQQQLAQRQADYQKQFDANKANFLSQYNSANSANDTLRNNLQGQAQSDKTGLSGLLTSLLGQYDQAYSGFNSKLGDFKDYSTGLANQGQGIMDEFGNFTNQQLQQTPQMYAPNIYTPNVNNLASAANMISPLMQQAQDTYAKTYGYNQDRLNQETQPYQQQFEQQKSGLSNSLNELGSNFVKESNNLYAPGMYDQGQYNAALSQEQNLSQQLRSNEQGVLSQLNNMYNFASTYSNKADNAFNTEKANRLNERATIQGQQQQDLLGGRMNQAENSAAQQVTNRRQNTMLSFNPDNQNLLSYLTRGY